MSTQSEAEVTCPFCWETIQLELDLLVSGQQYIEDCQVCCHPMRVTYEGSAGEITRLQVERAQ